MKFYKLFLLLYAFQFLFAIIGAYYLPAITGYTAVNTTELQGYDEETTTITEDNQFSIFNFKALEDFKSKTATILAAIKPTGEFLTDYFPNTFPSGIILLLNTLWGVLISLSVLEFFRGYRVVG